MKDLSTLKLIDNEKIIFEDKDSGETWYTAKAIQGILNGSHAKNYPRSFSKQKKLSISNIRKRINQIYNDLHPHDKYNFLKKDSVLFGTPSRKINIYNLMLTDEIINSYQPSPNSQTIGASSNFYLTKYQIIKYLEQKGVTDSDTIGTYFYRHERRLYSDLTTIINNQNLEIKKLESNGQHIIDNLKYVCKLLEEKDYDVSSP